MQTFLPYPNFANSAKALDRLRLGKQRIETLQILHALLGVSDGWVNHPATRMWRGHEARLALYGAEICNEWIQRGYRDSLQQIFIDYIHALPFSGYPPWFGDEDFHRAHRANLVRKDPTFYIPLFGDLPPEPYIWPV